MNDPLPLGAAALAAHLNALPIYVQLQAVQEAARGEAAQGEGEAARPLAGTAPLWPGWRARFRAANPLFREGQADVGLLNSCVWSLAAAHFAAALTLRRVATLDARLEWPQDAPYPFGTFLGDARLRPEGDLCAATFAALVEDLEALRPGSVLRDQAFWNTTADRSLQALLLAGEASGRAEEARAWAARLPELWPRHTRACLLESGELGRAACCFKDRYAASYPRCGNCPLTVRAGEPQA